MSRIFREGLVLPSLVKKEAVPQAKGIVAGAGKGGKQ
jgi:hypothetical protein